MRLRGHNKGNWMTMFLHFFCLCPPSLTLNFNISKVVYCWIFEKWTIEPKIWEMPWGSQNLTEIPGKKIGNFRYMYLERLSTFSEIPQNAFLFNCHWKFLKFKLEFFLKWEVPICYFASIHSYKNHFTSRGKTSGSILYAP